MTTTIKNLRKELGYSQAKLASLVGVTSNCIQKIESGANYPQIGTLKRIAEALNCELKIELIKKI